MSHAYCIFMKTEDLFCKWLRRVESIGAVVRALFTCLKPRATCDSSGMFCPCCWGYLWWGALACFPRCCALSLKSTSWPNLFLLWRTGLKVMTASHRKWVRPGVQHEPNPKTAIRIWERTCKGFFEHVGTPGILHFHSASANQVPGLLA